MEIEILDFEQDAKGFKIAKCDIKVHHDTNRYEIFRNVAIFNKDDKKWLSFPKTKKGEEWVLLYEREPSLHKIIAPQILKKLESSYL